MSKEELSPKIESLDDCLIIDGVKVYRDEILMYLDVYLHNAGTPNEECMQRLGEDIIYDIVQRKKYEQARN